MQARLSTFYTFQILGNESASGLRQPGVIHDLVCGRSLVHFPGKQQHLQHMIVRVYTH